MDYFLTGSTGFIGNELMNRLLSEGNRVHVLVRSAAKLRDPAHPGLKVFLGDITDREAVIKAMEGCPRVFHLAALAKPWAGDPGLFGRTNVEGTRHVLEAALLHKAERVVFTSSAGVIPPSGSDEDMNEEAPPVNRFMTRYAITKAAAEELCHDYTARGLGVVIVSPSRVYGPGILSQSNAIPRIAALMLRGKWRIIPGNGRSYGNYVFIDDVVSGHLLAMEKGRPGERYLLGGENITFADLLGTIRKAARTSHKLYHLPAPLLLFIAHLLTSAADLTGREPLITPEWIRNYLRHHRISSDKAIRELGYGITPFSTGIQKTVEWLKSAVL